MTSLCHDQCYWTSISAISTYFCQFARSSVANCSSSSMLIFAGANAKPSLQLPGDQLGHGLTDLLIVDRCQFNARRVCEEHAFRHEGNVLTNAVIVVIDRSDSSELQMHALSARIR